MITWLLVFLGALPLWADSPSISLLQQGDAAYAQRADLAKAKQALDAYHQVIAAEPGQVEACWKASKTAWWLGDQSTSHADKLAYFQQGIDAAKTGLTRDANSAESHFWLGANFGSFGQVKGVLKSLALVKPIRQEMAEVIRINDHFEGGGGYRVLGVVDYQVPGFAGGSKKRALEELNKALAIDPQNLFTVYYLAEYFKTVGEKDKMREQWNAYKALPVSEDRQPEYASLLKKGKVVFEK